MIEVIEINEKKYVTDSQDLEVFKLAYSLSLELHKISLTLPNHELYELGSQLRRASKSICLNISEGFALQDSKRNFKKFIIIALGSTAETKTCIQYLFDLNYISNEQFDNLSKNYIHLFNMLNKFKKSLIQ